MAMRLLIPVRIENDMICQMLDEYRSGVFKPVSPKTEVVKCFNEWFTLNHFGKLVKKQFPTSPCYALFDSDADAVQFRLKWQSTST